MKQKDKRKGFRSKMKRSMKIVGIAAIGLAILLASCKGKESERAGVGADTTALGKLEQELAALPMDSISYALGYVQGSQLREIEIKISEKSLLHGMRDAMTSKATMTDEQASELLRRYVQLYSRVKSERNLRRSEVWLDSVASVKGMERSESGLVFKVVEQGRGEFVNDSSYVQVHITIHDMSGKVLNDTRKGEPISFRLDRGLRCWKEGLKYIQEGGKIDLYSPSALAYGPYPANGIEPNSAMRFEIELVKILTEKEYEAAMRQTDTSR